MNGFEKREEQEEKARQREEASSPGQRYAVVEDRGWVQDGVYGARLIVVAPVGGLGYPPEQDDLLIATGQKHDARSELPPRAGYRSPGDEPEPRPGEPPPHMGHASNHPH